MLLDFAKLNPVKVLRKACNFGKQKNPTLLPGPYGFSRKYEVFSGIWMHHGRKPWGIHERNFFLRVVSHEVNRDWGMEESMRTRNYLLSGIYLLLYLSISVHQVNAQASDPTYETLKQEAEQYYAEGSFRLAHERYVQANALGLSLEEQRWVDFRVADTLWRAQAATETADSTIYDQARAQLEVLVRDISRIEDHDRISAEVQESLGDFWWERRDSKNYQPAWSYYQQALDFWAGAADVELARKRYLAIVWTIAKPHWAEPYYYYGYYGNTLPVEILENVLKIAKTDRDIAHVHYLLAMTIRYQGGDWEARQRVSEEFEAALSAGPSTDWYDDALYYYAEWLSSNGRVIPLEDGEWRQEPDYVKALELFQHFLKEFREGESRYYDQAKQQIEQITKPVVGVAVSEVFLPDSEIQYYLNWRNVKRIELALYPIDLTKDLSLQGKQDVDASQWLEHLKLDWRGSLRTWSKIVEDKGDYRPGQETLRLDGRLPMGAYLLEAKAGGVSARELILVTDAAVVLKTSLRQALVYVCNSLDGSPIPQGRVSLWERFYDGNHWVWRQQIQTANPEGLVVFDLPRLKPDEGSSRELLVATVVGDRQAFSLGSSYDYGRSQDTWRLYAFTDRSAYRPGETLQWKLIARRTHNSIYSTPAHQAIEFEIYDPRGTKMHEGKTTLNAFGSAVGELTLLESLPLGEYRIHFWIPRPDGSGRDAMGEAPLFRLEEYKLPEFKVTVHTPEEADRPKAFRLGDKVEVEIEAEYYFGGPVANATAEILVYQNPFYHSWQMPREFPWFYEDHSKRQRHFWGGEAQIIKRETLKTDAAGKTRLSFQTPRGTGQDFEYRIEARVTDASRRETIGSGSIRVTRQRYYAYLHPAHNLYRPQDKVSVAIKTIDANEEPVVAEGWVQVTRDSWHELWVDSSGKEITGEELTRVRGKHPSFPRLPTSEEPSWHLKSQGYEHEEILKRRVKTNAEGEAEFSFTPEREGYYRVSWVSEDQGRSNIKAESAVWVANNQTTELGYRYGGLEIILDKDTFKVGQKAPVMLSVPTNDRYVLFSVEAEDLHSYQLVHMDGTVKLLELVIEERHVPNIFLGAAMVSDQQLFVDTKEVIVPPVQQFLQVEVTPDRAEYQPRESGSLTVTTRDHEGKPVSAEVALALVDESVSYIQEDYAQDPRRFYYGTKREQHVQIQSSFQQKRYAKLIEGEEHRLIDEREILLGEARTGDRVGGGEDTFPTGSLEENGKATTRSFKLANAQVAEEMYEGRENKKLETDVSESQRRLPASPHAIEGQGGVVQVRSDFRSTAFWQPDIVTDHEGKAKVHVTYPDSLTTWKATARVASSGSHFGMATASTHTKQALIVRLQAPRFFVVGDTVTVSAIINNNTDAVMRIAPSLKAEGVAVTGIDWKGRQQDPDREIQPGPIEIPAQGQMRIDWHVAVRQSGMAKLKVMAIGGEYTDAMEKTYIVYEHGIEKFISKSGKVRGDEVTVKLDIPKERKRDSTTLAVQITPSLAVTMLDALPYLADYPYGCTEQTMSRFLPAVITAKTLRELGLKPEVVEQKLFGGIEQEYVDKTHPEGKQDLNKLNKMVKEGLDRLYDFQHSDGGWGWWKEGESDHFMSAYVVWGLTLARDAKMGVRADVLERGVNYLNQEMVEEEMNYDKQAWMLHALATYHASTRLTDVGEFQAKAFENLWDNREGLNAYTRALLTLAAHHFGYVDKKEILIRNLENGVKQDNSPDTSIVQRDAQASHEAVMGTAHWGEDGITYRWSDGGVEATAFALRALLAIDPQNALIEPVTNWLIKNRRGAQWSNTRDTAIVVLTLNEYLRASGELNPDVAYELLVNGRSITTQRLAREDALSVPSQFDIDRQYLRDGENEVRIRRLSGKSPLYFSTHAEYFSLEEPIPPAGNEIFVRRQYTKLAGRPTLLKGYVYDKQPLNDGEVVPSGERIETVITIEAKNDYEYLVFEDLKPAGFEAVQLRSGESLYAQELKAAAATHYFGEVSHSPVQGKENPSSPLGEKDKETVARLSRRISTHPIQPTHEASDYTGRTRWVYQELRDRKVALFIDKLPEGIWEIRYDLRAEVPGTFHALPVMGHAMYVPEIRCNGEEINVTVEDRE